MTPNLRWRARWAIEISAASDGAVAPGEPVLRAGGAVLPQGAVDKESPDAGAGTGTGTATLAWRDARPFSGTLPGVTPPARDRFSM
ncbi:hypothetical protein D3C87_1516010 [compost metagenome]